jgi:hypothetical protein
MADSVGWCWAADSTTDLGTVKLPSAATLPPADVPVLPSSSNTRLYGPE